MIRKRLRNHFGIAARSVAIRTHLPWPWRAARLFLFIVFSGFVGLGVWSYSANRPLADLIPYGSRRDDEALQKQIAHLQTTLIEARRATATNESQLRIEMAAREKLLAEFKILENENSRLKADLAAFENLATSGRANSNGLVMSQLQVLPSASPGEYRYRLMLAQGGVHREDQKGKLRFIATIQQGTKIMTTQFMFHGDASSNEVTFRGFRRFEDVFTIPVDAQLKSLEAQFLKDGTIKVSQVAAL